MHKSILFPDNGRYTFNLVKKLLQGNIHALLQEAGAMDLTMNQEVLHPKNYKEACQAAGLKSELKEEDMKESTEKDNILLRKILLSFAASKKAFELYAASHNLMQEVVMAAPELRRLENIFQTFQFYNSKPVLNMRLHTKYPQSSTSVFNKEYSPRRIGKQFKCRVCERMFGSWTGCDSHIRQSHSHIYYGPCSKNCSFKSANIDSFRRHQQKCH